MASNTISITNIRDLIDEEIAKLASRASTDDGSLLYDSLVNYSKDSNEIDRAVTDCVSAEQSEMSDIIESATYDNGVVDIAFNLPDHPADWSNETHDLGRLIACDVVVNWFKKRGHEDYVSVMTENRDSALVRLKRNLYRRKPISRD